jgi:ABC-type transport system involved in multi-copper enzyme maturation permease subunit
MNWLTWRQHRIEALIALLALIILAIIFIPSGLKLYALYQASELPACLAQHAACQETRMAFMQHAARLGPSISPSIGLSGMSIDFSLSATSIISLLPLAIGIFVGAPLVSREQERHTHYLAWTQSITRYRWLVTQLGWIAGATLLASILLATLVTWWATPLSNADGPWYLGDIQGTVLIGSTLFGLMLGVACGTVLRHTVPAMVLTIVIFLLVQMVLGFAHPYLVPPQSHLYPLGIQDGTWGHPGDLTLYAGYADQAGHETGEISQYCHFNAALGDPSYGPLANKCIQEHHLQWKVVFQPPEMFWTLQGIETAILLLLAAALVVFTFWWLRKRTV